MHVSLIEEELNFTLAREATGIVGGRVKREKIRDLVNRAKGELLVGHVARASPRLAIKDGKLVADITRSDRVGLVVGNTLRVLGRAPRSCGVHRTDDPRGTWS